MSFLHSRPIFTVQEGISRKRWLFIKIYLSFHIANQLTLLYVKYENHLKNVIPNHLRLRLYPDCRFQRIQIIIPSISWSFAHICLKTLFAQNRFSLNLFFHGGLSWLYRPEHDWLHSLASQVIDTRELRVRQLLWPSSLLTWWNGWCLILECPPLKAPWPSTCPCPSTYPAWRCPGGTGGLTATGWRSFWSSGGLWGLVLTLWRHCSICWISC